MDGGMKDVMTEGERKGGKRWRVRRERERRECIMIKGEMKEGKKGDEQRDKVRCKGRKSKRER